MISMSITEANKKANLALSLKYVLYIYYSVQLKKNQAGI